MRFRASDVARATGGRLIGPDTDIVGASFDTRDLVTGMLFVPVVAERDGHEFIADAVSSGAAATLTERGHGYDSLTAIDVTSTTDAFGALACWLRSTDDHAPQAVVGVTGSVGKTTTKDLVASALVSHGVHAAVASLNNDLGVPSTIVNAPDRIPVIVCEMGMRGPGQISRLCDVAHPDIGVVTRVGAAHTQLLGGLDHVATAKAELVQALPASGTAVLNADDDRVAAMAILTTAGVVTYGRNGEVCAETLDIDALGRHRVTVRSPWGSIEVRIPVPGAHMVSNSLAAAAVCGVVTGSLDGLGAIEEVSLSSHRMRTIDLGHCIVVDDSYNANPTSMVAALDALEVMDVDRRIAVLGAMAEIADSEEQHLKIAAEAAERGIDVIAVATSAYGQAPADDVIDALRQLTTGSRRVAIVVKASRSARLETVAAEIISAFRR